MSTTLDSTPSAAPVPRAVSKFPYQKGDFVKVNFPFDDRPTEPAKSPHTGYVLMQTMQGGKPHLVVLYTTSKVQENAPGVHQGHVPKGVVHVDQETSRYLEQQKPFLIDGRKVAILPLEPAWFPDMPDGRHGRPAHKALRSKIDVNFEEVTTRSPHVRTVYAGRSQQAGTPRPAPAKAAEDPRAYRSGSFNRDAPQPDLPKSKAPEDPRAYRVGTFKRDSSR